MSNDWFNRIEAYLWPNGFKRDVWMVVDAARDKQISALLCNYFFFEPTCLFSGKLTPELEEAAPYLIQLTYDDQKTRQFIHHAWGNSWASFLRCNVGLDPLLAHLRGRLVARDEMGNHMIFRYYDPRVLRVHLPACTEGELQVFFGPVDCFLMEADTPDTLLEFSLDKKKLVVTKRLLDQPDEAAG
jgi:hypothetical protein